MEEVKEERVFFKRETLKKYVSEPVLFFLFASFGFRFLATQQILQDKICLINFNMTEDYCRNISLRPTSQLKRDILDEIQYMSSCRTVLAFLVQTLCPLYLFIGGFCDAYKNARRIALLGIVLDGILQTVIVILNNVFMSWSAWVFIVTTLSPIHDYSAITIVMSYITANSSKEERASRFLFISVLFMLGLAFGVFITGLLLNTTMPLIQPIAPQQIHNIMLPLLIGLSFQTCALCWTYFFIHERTDEPLVTDDNQNITSVGAEERRDDFRSTLRKLFDLKMLKASYETITKKRPKNMRFYLYLIIAAHVLITFTQIGPMNNIMPVMQLLYKWDPSVFSRYVTLGLLWKPIATLLITPLVTKVFKFSDLQIAFFGAVGVFLGDLSIGSIVRPAGYYLNMLLSACSVCASTGLKAHLSKEIPADEITKTYTFMQLIDSFIPPSGAIIYTMLVSLTQSFYPTMIFHFSALIVLVAMLIIMFIDLSSKSLEREEKEEDTKSNAPSEGMCETSTGWKRNKEIRSAQ